MAMVVGSLSAQSNKNKYPQTKVYRGDSVVILTVDQSNYINKTFKEQKEALDSFKVITIACFGIASVDKFITLTKGKKEDVEK